MTHEMNTAAGQFTVSDAGSLIYASGGAPGYPSSGRAPLLAASRPSFSSSGCSGR
jgi:hypothetical protein